MQCFLRWLYARRYSSGQPDRSAARAATLSRLERPQRAVLLRHGSIRQSAPGARIPRFGRHVYAGLRALTHGVEGATCARIAAWYTSSFTVGASLSFLFGRVGMLLGWRSAFVIAGILGAAGVVIALAALPGGDTGDKDDPQPRLDFRPVLANRDVLALIVGYAAAIWGCVGLRQWIVVFLTFGAGDQAADPA